MSLCPLERRPVREHARRDLVAVRAHVRRQLQRSERRLDHLLRSPQHRRVVEEELIDRRAARRVVLLADLPKHRDAGHHDGDAALVRVLPAVLIRVLRCEHHVQAVDHHHVRLETGGLEGRALERQREVRGRRARVRTPRSEPRRRPEGVMEDQQAQRRLHPLGARFDGPQQRREQRRRPAARPQERSPLELVGAHFVPPVRARKKLAMATVLNSDVIVPFVWRPKIVELAGVVGPDHVADRVAGDLLHGAPAHHAARRERLRERLGAGDLLRRERRCARRTSPSDRSGGPPRPSSGSCRSGRS